MNLEELIEKIKVLDLDDSEEAFKLYTLLCDCLKEKYGLVNRDYDKNPKKRGKEWLDIHHVLEYKLDNIANRTETARDLEKEIRNHTFDNQVVIGLKSSEWTDEKMEEIRKQYPNKSVVFRCVDYTLEELKPYNVQEQLVYANKIEHFLLHYLIVLFGDKRFYGGPNYLWDNSIALDIYGFDHEFMNNLKNEKEKFYSVLSSEEITLLYKKLIDWKNWETCQCSRYWMNYKNIIRSLNERQVSYVEDKDKFFRLLDILGFTLDKDIKNEIETLPYKIKIVKVCGIMAKEINEHIYSMDEKTALSFRIHATTKSFTVPNNVERIASGAFFPGFDLEKITIPVTVKEIEDKAFTGYPYNLKLKGCVCSHLKTIYYKGTKSMWDANFSNVEIADGVTVVCKKNCNSF